MNCTLLVEQELREYLSSRGAGGGLAPHTDLLSTGILDSLLIMDLIARLERAYGVRLASDDVSPENFRTTRALADLVTARRMEPATTT